MSKVKKRNVFAGVDDIWLTHKSIAVKNVETVRTKSGFSYQYDTVKYYKKNEKNLRNAKAIHGYIRYGK